MKRDPRPIWQQVLSGLRIAAVLIGCGAAAIILASYIPRYRIEAWFWHVRHGSSIGVARYRIPVPQHWYVSRDSGNDVLLVDLDSGDMIWAWRDEYSQRLKLSAWSNLTLHPPASVKTQSTGQREFHINGEAFLCIEQDTDIEIAHLYPIQCRSDRGLTVDFQPYIRVGREHNAGFYALLQQIQKL